MTRVRPTATLAVLSLVILLRVMGVFLVLVGFAEHWTSLGGSDATMGAGFAAYALALALFLLPLGALSDRFGPRRVMVGALLVSAVGGVLAAFAPTPLLFAAGRFVQGMGAVNGIALAVLGDAGEPDKRTRRMAAVGAAAGAGVVLGLLGSAFLHRAGVTIPTILLAFSAATLATVPLVARVLPRDAPAQAPMDGRSLRVALLLGAAAFVVNFVLTAVLLFTRPGIEAQFPRLGYEGALIVMLLPAGLGMYLASRLADRGRARSVGIGAALVLVAAPLEFFGPQGPATLLAVGILFFIAHASLSALLPSLASRLAPQGRRGVAQGVQSTLQYLGSAVGPSLVGVLLATRYAAAVPLVFGAAGVLLVTVLFVATRERVPSLGSGEGLS